MSVSVFRPSPSLDPIVPISSFAGTASVPSLAWSVGPSSLLLKQIRRASSSRNPRGQRGGLSLCRPVTSPSERIRDVSGPLLAERPDIPPAARRQHVLDLAFDPKLEPGGGASDLRIVTDHPHQPELTISLMVSSSD